MKAVKSSIVGFIICTIFLSNCGVPHERETIVRWISHDTLDFIIVENFIDINKISQELRAYPEMVDVGIDEKFRVESMRSMLEAEVAYLKTLRANGGTQVKKAYCEKTLDKQIAAMTYQIKSKRFYGEHYYDLYVAAILGWEGRLLTEKEIEEIRKKLKETTNRKATVKLY